jgi:outer membrane protein OmpA-like peptidoglycan-associated protein
LGNEVLSTRRADAVASYLRSAGVSVPIAVDGRGDRDPVSDGSLAANRTVEIAVSCGTA